MLCVLWNQAYDFLDLCEETDLFVWPTTDLRCVPDSILHDIKVNPEDDKSRPPWEIGTEDLFLQTLDVYLPRVPDARPPYVGESDILRQAPGPLRHHDRDRLRRGRRQIAAGPGYDFRPA